MDEDSIANNLGLTNYQGYFNKDTPESDKEGYHNAIAFVKNHLSLLVKDGTVVYYPKSQTYQITDIGQLFLDKGGYVPQRQRVLEAKKQDQAAANKQKWFHTTSYLLNALQAIIIIIQLFRSYGG